MNFRRKTKLTSEVSTHSLNDIMFFLLLFFLIASTMANPNVIKVMLPKAQSEGNIDKKRHYLTIDKDKNYLIDKKSISKASVKAALIDLKGTNEETTVVLNIDSSVSWGEVVEILDIGKEINVKMVAATQKK